MKDTVHLRRRIATALICFPLIAGFMLCGIYPFQATAEPPSNEAEEGEYDEEEYSEIRTSHLFWCGGTPSDLERVAIVSEGFDEKTKCPLIINRDILREATKGEVPKFSDSPGEPEIVAFKKELTARRSRVTIECCYGVYSIYLSDCH